MLYNSQLETFILVADCGSFSKAAQIGYVTPAAVMKKINQLERELDVTLFERSHQGLRLTSAGKILYHDAKYLIKFSGETVARTQNAQAANSRLIRIGTSTLNPTNFLSALWPRIHRNYPDIRLEIISFDHEPEYAVNFYQNLGYNLDVVGGVFDEKLLERFGCNGLKLKDIPLRCAVPMNHGLASKNILEFEDFFHERLLMIQEGWFQGADALRAEIERSYPMIQIRDMDYFDIRYFNECENLNCFMIGVDVWKNVHPLLRMLPVNWNYTIPYGLFYAREPSEDVRYFLDAVMDIL